MSVTLTQASTIVDVALKKGRDTNCAPLTVAVLDAGGHLVAFKREDKSGILRFDIAYGKAWGALGMGFGSRELADRAGKNPLFFGVLATVSQGRLVPVPGGVLIKDASGAVLGAVGISGDTSDKDEVCAIAGIEATGLGAESITTKLSISHGLWLWIPGSRRSLSSGRPKRAGPVGRAAD